MVKAGILGGGQLGRMLLQAAANYNVETFVLDNDSGCPSAHLCHHFIQGSIKDYSAVYNFGKLVDVLTIEIENVNLQALQALEEEGLLVIPNTATLRTIKNKILQKQFYHQNEIPSSTFVTTNTAEELLQHIHFLPAVHKLAEGGYDGKGVKIISNENDFATAFDEASVLEKMVDIHKEIAISIAVSTSGALAIYAPVDMVFDKRLHLLSYQKSPAVLPQEVYLKAEAIALKLVKAFNSPGLFAIELFTDAAGNVWVNETAPRVHNSGHHSIEACYSSQFDMVWRILLQYPLGNTAHILPAAIVNLVGEEGHSGEVYYQGLEDVLKMDNIFVHLYGKKETRPGRKMGHVTILSNEKQELEEKVIQIKSLLKVISS